MTSTTSPSGIAVPFNRPTIAPNQLAYLAESFGSEKICGDGAFTARAVGALEQHLGTSRILLTPSCTAALEMCAILLDIGPGDEVIVPSFTFVSTANAFALMGASIVFADIDPVDLNVDPVQVESLVTERTKAIVAVHYGGVPADLQRLLALCERHDIALIEDAAHSLFASHRGQPLGSFGVMSTFSFHETKNASSGEGGALVINDERLWDRARVIREKGTDRSRFLEGLVDKYTWVDRGSSYLLADPLAAVLLAQVEFAATIQARRRRAASTYHRELASWAAANGVAVTRSDLPEEERAAHLHAMLLPSREERDRFLAHARQRGVTAVFHYLPLHSSPAGRRFGEYDCPVTDDVSGRLARIPLFSDVTDAEVERVVETVLSFEARS